MVLSVGQLDRSYQRDNLSVHPQCDIQKPLRINTQPQLQSSESHHTLASSMQAFHHLPDTDIHEKVSIGEDDLKMAQNWGFQSFN